MHSGDSCAREAKHAQSQRHDAGFTLVEMLVVLAILGLTLATATWAIKPVRDRNVVMRTMGSFRTLSAAAREQAIGSGETIALSIDIADRALKIPILNRTEPLSHEVSLSWVSASVASRRPRETSILFLPDGTSTGGRLSAKAGGAVGAVRISWVSGAAVDEP